MMYSEFLALSDKTENYISYAEYTNEIEPIYTDCELCKADFIALMNETFNKIVYPAVEKAIKNTPFKQKEAYVFAENNNTDFEKEIAKVDQEARKVAYEYMKLYSKL